MINAGNISFYDLMTAGYISAETYRFLQPKVYFCELTTNEINSYEYRYQRELRPLFYDDGIYMSIKCWSELENDLLENETIPIKLLEDCLDSYPFTFSRYIYNLGYKNFLHNYVYCTRQSLQNRLPFRRSYEDLISKLRTDFRCAYQSYCLNDTHKASNILNTPIVSFSDERDVKDNLLEGKGFAPYDLINIEKDAISSANNDCYKYVLYLFSLDKDQLDPIIGFLCNQLECHSVRLTNAIKSIGYRNFLINFLYAEPLKIRNIKNLGIKSFYDIEDIKPSLCEYIRKTYDQHDTDYIEREIEKEEQIKFSENVTLKEKIGVLQYDLLRKKLRELSDNLSVRSRTRVLNYCGDFIEDFVYRRNDVKIIKNIGRKSAEEIKVVVEQLRDLIDTMKDRCFSDEEMLILDKKICYRHFFSEFEFSYFKEHKHLPMFHLIENFFKEEEKINRNFRIFNLRTPIFQDIDNLTLEEIAEKQGLTRERVRQIYMKYRNHLCKGIDTKNDDKDEVTYTTIIHNKSDWNYAIDEFQMNNYIDSSMLSGYSAQENLHFTDEFLLFLIWSICEKSFVPVGKPILPYPTNTNSEWNNCYLIKKELAEKFDFIRLFELIKDFENTSTEDLKASAREMIIDTFVSAWINYDSNAVEEVSDVVSNLLIQELGIIPDEQFCFIIEGKKEENIADIIYDILKSNGNPMSCDDLFLSVDSVYPHKCKSKASIRYLVEHDSRLCLVGSNNLVALIEWEHVKLGSIRNIIVQYLEGFDEPQQAKDIVSYVQRYRETTDNSIRATMGSGQQFVQFSGGYYGLSWKKYPEMYYLDESDRAFYKRVQELEQFLQVHNHFPFASTNPKEQDLHDWWINIKSYTKLSKYQKSELKRIESEYKNLARKKKQLAWFGNCRKYLEFVQENHRRPLKINPEEQELCRWLQKASEDFSNGTLTRQQELSYLDLCKSL